GGGLLPAGPAVGSGGGQNCGRSGIAPKARLNRGTDETNFGRQPALAGPDGRLPLVWRPVAEQQCGPVVPPPGGEGAGRGPEQPLFPPVAGVPGGAVLDL